MPLPKNAKNDEYQRLERQNRVADLYVQGLPQWRIAQELGVTQGTVSNDLAAVRARWKEAQGRAYDERIGEEVAKLERMEQELWKAWFDSCRDAEGTTTRVEKARRPPPKEKVKGPKGRGDHAVDVPPPGKGRGKVIAQSGTFEDEVELVPVKETVERWVKGRLGNPAYLHEARECARLRCELLGLLKKDAATTNNVLVLDGEFWQNLTTRPDFERADPLKMKIKAIEEGEDK